jgi:hypothetical protein
MARESKYVLLVLLTKLFVATTFTVVFVIVAVLTGIPCSLACGRSDGTLIRSKPCLPAWTLSMFASCRLPTVEVGGLLLVWPERPTLIRYKQGALLLTSVNCEHGSSAYKQKLKPVEEVQSPVKML